MTIRIKKGNHIKNYLSIHDFFDRTRSMALSIIPIDGKIKLYSKNQISETAICIGELLKDENPTPQVQCPADRS